MNSPEPTLSEASEALPSKEVASVASPSITPASASSASAPPASAPPASAPPASAPPASASPASAPPASASPASASPASASPASASPASASPASASPASASPASASPASASPASASPASAPPASAAVVSAKQEPASKALSTAAMLAKADRYRERDRPNGALVLYEKVLAKNAASLPAMTGIAWCLLDLKRFDQSIRMFNRVLAKAPRVGDAHMGLAEIYRFQGDSEGAKKHYRAYLEISPNGSEAGFAKSMLRQLQ